MTDSLKHRYEEAKASEHPRFDPLYNENVERTYAMMDREREQRILDLRAKVCPKR